MPFCHVLRLESKEETHPQNSVYTSTLPGSLLHKGKQQKGLRTCRLLDLLGNPPRTGGIPEPQLPLCIKMRTTILM